MLPRDFIAGEENKNYFFYGAVLKNLFSLCTLRVKKSEFCLLFESHSTTKKSAIIPSEVRK